ncbi:MAG TPA: iron-containing alcohol dehydrogenase [Vicinamibacteria bacterium]
MNSFDYQPRPRLVFGRGEVERLGELALAEGFRRTLFVADRGLMATPHAERAIGFLRGAGIEVGVFTDFSENPDTEMMERGRAFAAPIGVDSLVGFGGGSSMDTAKGVSFLLTNGGTMADYRGFGKARTPLLPMLGVPTTAGTGSEAQSYALVSDAKTHEKMACGDETAMFKVALLDPELTLTQPAGVTAVAGFDAISHAVETYVTRKQNPLSDVFSREAFRLLFANYERVLERPLDVDARSSMQLGAYFAGVAIENSMLGATHACANPLTAHYGTAHGRAISMCLPSVVRFNAAVASERYRELLGLAGVAVRGNDPGETLAFHLERLARTGGLPTRLRDDGISRDDFPALAREASLQWTGTFNPRPFDEGAALEVYRCAY